MPASWAAERSSVFTLKQGAFVSTDRALAIACDMLEGMGHRLAALVAMAAMLGACSTAEELRPIATGSAWGGDTRDGNYEWTVVGFMVILLDLLMGIPRERTHRRAVKVS